MSGMFTRCTSFNQNIGNWNVSNVTDMSSMFNSCSLFNKTLNFDINSIDLEGKYGYFIECDLEYPKEIYDLHQNLPLAPEVLEINYDSLSPYAQTALIESDERQKYKDVKLMATFADRINYITHSKNLKLYLDLGMKLKKIHRILKFRQKLLIAPYIEKCTIARQKATSKFQMDQYKKLVIFCLSKIIYIRCKW
jgi:surface protein